MDTIEITLPDASIKKVKKGITALEMAKSISEGLARNALILRVDNQSVSHDFAITNDASFRVLTWKDREAMDDLRHSCAHLLAAAVMDLWPDTKRTIGPSIEDGFYFDFEFTKPISADDLPKIEAKMLEILPSWKAFERHELSAGEAKKEYPKNQYKHELIEEFSKGGKKVSFYKSGEYWDLCRGGHVLNPEQNLKHFKLLSVAGAYWRGDEKNTMLTRIYGTAFPAKKELDNYLWRIEEAKKRDHRKVGKEMELINFQEESPGAVFYLPKGTIIFNELQSFLRQQYLRRGYQEVITPLVYDKSLFETSGHWSHYRESMFTFKLDNTDVALKPMNCPSHCIIYKMKSKSYRDLPLRIADFAALHRNELRGVLAGMTRVRKFHQDDAHIFCTDEQVKDELVGVLNFTKYVYSEVFKLDFTLELSTKPPKAIGNKEQWDEAEKILKGVLEEQGLAYNLNAGDGAFYGPKIDLHIKDSLARSWQLATIQLDFQHPSRFELSYEGNDGKKHTPVMIHRAIFGTFERFMGILIEHYAGKFPLWLNPVQVKIVTVADRFVDYAKDVQEKMLAAGIRVDLNARAESIAYKVREAQAEKVNYIVVIGEKEEKEGKITPRNRENQVESALNVETFIKKIVADVKQKL